MKRAAAGDQKPPLAPKPKVLPAPKQTEHPAASKLCVYQPSSTAVKCKVKPDVAPKPCLSKLPPSAFNSKHLTSKVGHQAVLQQKSDITKTIGALNFRNEAHTGNNKPEWDYIIPICVCNDRNCADCSPKENNQNVRQQSPDKYKAGKTEGPRKNPSKPPLRTPEEQKDLVTPTSSKCISEHSSSNSNHFHPTEKPRKTSQNTEPLKAHQSGSEMQTTRKHQNNIVSSVNSSVDGDPEPLECQQALNSVQYCPFPTKPPVKAPPAAMQHKTKKKQSSIVLQESTDLTKTELTVLPVDVNNPDPLRRESPNNVNINAARRYRENKDAQAARGAKGTQGISQGAPTPAPCQKIPQMQQNKTQDVGVQATEKKVQNLDAIPEVVEISVSSGKHLKKKTQKPQADGRRHDNIGATELSVDRLPKKKPASKSPLRNDGKNAEGHPPLAVEKKQASDVLNKKRLKPKSKSLSSADILKPDGLKKTSFLWIMDFDRVKKVPKVSVKSGQADDLTPVMNEQPVDTEESQRKICSQKPMPLHNGHPDALKLRQAVNGNILGVEQHVDEDLDNVGESEHAYEDITECENLPPFSTATAQNANKYQYQSSKYEDDGIYEVPDVFPEHYVDAKEQQFLERNVLEEVQEVDDTHSEEDEGSSEDEDNTVNKEKQTEAKKTKVAHIVNEILSSEKIFVKVLKLLHVDFRDAASCQAGKPVIDERVLNQILCYLPQLYELNCDLLRELEERVAHWNEHCSVADIFVKKGPYLKMYSTYIREFDKNVALLEEQCRKNPAFAKAVQEFESHPCCANLAVKHYMLKPIQRIPQYQLLLTSYLNNLDEESPDYKDAEAALMIVKEVANHANEIVRHEDNCQKLYEVQCHLTGHHVIVQPGRVLLKEGILMKLSRKGMQPRMLFLLNDSLLYTTPVATGNFKLNNILSLAEMEVSKPSQEGYQNELNIESVERSFILSASSAACRDEWLQAISTAIDDYTKKETTFTSVRNPEMATQDVPDSGAQLGSKAPIWIPDLRATMCMICTCEFTLTWRRHHCRSCGKVVCQACSTNKQPLKYLKNHLARVCDLCFSTLQQNSSGDQVPSNTPLSPTGKSPGAYSFRKQKKIPAALKEVSANTDGSSMSGYLERAKANRKQWKRFWFVIMNKVLYTYAASEDVAALESQPLLGFSVRTEKPESSLHFKLYHKNTLYYIFRASDSQICDRWIEAIQEATVL
ncbi:FYVE, RhoGEF and PH domain-containing protein 6-like [Sinocyclocheilus anshuiensis]|uniref:FYVE, RhoGEF and PH domain-containing protein 6-like n=1 Tax=Sinocyclocheilus anshuiensis TaxID=1608454 RepID=UPI0007B895A1|nr:PREDICTED: FYVE, RhoGEF and PH domain-containing protein 6-like [Sinocyclocheilus anshuiensis]